MKPKILAIAYAVLWLTSRAGGQGLPPELRTSVEAKVNQLRAWSTDPQIVAAVKEYNANPPAEAKSMTNEKWKALTLLDPFVRSYSKNSLATYLKTRKDDVISELFVSGADGCKLAFLSKTTWWCHRGREKHDIPMKGKIWVGSVEVDESTGKQAVQIGLPVLDGGKPIGSIVVGLSVAELRDVR